MAEDLSERRAGRARSALPVEVVSGALSPASEEPASSARAGSAAKSRSPARIGIAERMGGRDATGNPRPDQAPRSLVDQLGTVPNVLTLARLAAVPFFVAALARGQDLTALAIFAGAAATDGIDGLLARVLDQRTPLGAVLDPIADKLLTLSAVTTLAFADRLPWWLLGLVLARDAAMALGVLFLRMRGRSLVAAPTRLGKYATFLLAVTMVLAILSGRPGSGALEPWVAAAALVSAECVLASLVQYFTRWRRWMRGPA